jgi:hypothetical protein
MKHKFSMFSKNLPPHEHFPLYSMLPQTKRGADVVVIVWKFDLQLPVQSVPITTNVVSLNPAHARCIRYNIMR